jgi:hypothetical protein
MANETKEKSEGGKILFISKLDLNLDTRLWFCILDRLKASINAFKDETPSV